MAEALSTREAFLKAREFLRRSGWSARAIADQMGISEITVRQYAQAPGTPGARPVPEDRLARLQAAARLEAAELVLAAVDIMEREEGR